MKPEFYKVKVKITSDTYKSSFCNGMVCNTNPKAKLIDKKNVVINRTREDIKKTNPDLKFQIEIIEFKKITTDFIIPIE